jgi:hypothetical protein
VQKGKALHSALPLNAAVRQRIAGIIVISFLLPWNALGMAARGHPLRPGDHLDPFVSLVRGVYALCYSSCARPYGIDDLLTYRALVGARIERLALWAQWEACAHPFYRLDELRIRICLQPFDLPVSVVLEPVLLREAVEGFPTTHSTGLAAVFALNLTNLAFSLRREVVGRAATSSTLVACSARIDRLSLTVAGCGGSGGYSFIDVEGELSIDRLIFFRTGYRLDTEEIRCGLGCRRGRILVTALWAHHPALGRTISLGVGYVWPR